MKADSYDFKKLDNMINSSMINGAKSGEKKSVEELFLIYYPLIRNYSKKYYLKGAELDDLIQEALFGFLEAIRDFDYKMGVGFSYFVSLCVTRQLKQSILKFDRKKHEPLNTYVSLDAPVETEDSTFFYEKLIDDENTPEQQLIKKEQLSFIKKGDANLSKLEREVLSYYLEGLDYKEMESILSKDYKAIDNTMQRIKKKMGDALKKYDK